MGCSSPNHFGSRRHTTQLPSPLRPSAFHSAWQVFMLAQAYNLTSFCFFTVACPCLAWRSQDMTLHTLRRVPRQDMGAPPTPTQLCSTAMRKEAVSLIPCIPLAPSPTLPQQPVPHRWPTHFGVDMESISSSVLLVPSVT